MNEIGAENYSENVTENEIPIIRDVVCLAGRVAALEAAATDISSKLDLLSTSQDAFAAMVEALLRRIEKLEAKTK
jgi:hypothetical protein